ncbi:MAG: 4,5-DOPA dioxygenase extradiol [Burkholderiaceae bacterium]|nr:4,5-DOPA dioxygenase extradiol [Burkholderiaceae bacterium]MDH3460835.1 4,5-DOPA dioxygenase extradiol [Burkholderiaceae bacterium]
MSANPHRMPTLFLGHGNPMNAIEQNQFHLRWQRLGQQLPRPKVVLCISAHWETRGVHVTASEQPQTIHDFYGFPKALFSVEYPAKGDPELAHRVADLLPAHKVGLDFERGLDHGAWSVLLAIYAKADVPVVQLSLDTGQSAAFHYALARQLAPLREEGVLILGSGNIVHNLRRFSYDDQTPFDWAVEFDEVVKSKLASHDHEPLIDYGSLGQHAPLAIPTAEHYLPLMYALAVQDETERPQFFNNVVLSSISMTSVLIGA